MRFFEEAGKQIHMPWASRYARQIAVGILVAYWCVIALGTHIPAGEIHAPGRSDLGLHFVAYAGLAFLLAWSTMRRRPTLAKAALVVLVSVAYGGIDELTQNFVPSRHADLSDWWADCIGVAVGMAAYYLTWRVVRPRPRWKPVGWSEERLPVHDAA